MQINKSEIEQLLTHGELEKAIDYFLQLSKQYDARLYQQLIHQSSRFHGLAKDIRQGVVGQEYATLQHNKIKMALSEILQKVPNEWQLVVASPEPDPPQTFPRSVAEPSTSSSHNKINILFLAANPKDTPPLRLDEEVRKIDNSLRLSQTRDRFIFTQKWAIQIPDLRRAMLDQEPQIVHFSGHGSRAGKIIVENPLGDRQEVGPEALGNFFELFNQHLQCVLLNACWSEQQANEIARHVPYVIGMKRAVPDGAAIAFSEAFYDAIGAGRDYTFAFKLAQNAVQLYNLPADQIPVMKTQS